MVGAALVLLALLGVSASAQEGNSVNWPLSQAVIANDLARMKTLLTARPSQDELDFALIAAAGNGRPEAALLLLTSGASPKREASHIGHTSVMVAIQHNQLETLMVLLEHGGDPNGADQLGWRPLHHTLKQDYERPGAIRVLVQHGAVVDGRDGLQRTALHRAAGFGHAESVRVLLELGADPSLREKYGQSAAERAEHAGHLSVVHLIQSSQGTTVEPEVIEPTDRTEMDSTQRNSGELVLNILINWLFGLLPAAFLRFLILQRPLSKKPAILVTVGVAVFLVFMVTGLAHLAGIMPNMGPVAMWIFLTYKILRSGSQRESKALKSENEKASIAVRQKLAAAELDPPETKTDSLLE